MATRELPLEVITEILSRLPVKPLFRFKCVSKPFQSLLNSPIFIKLHLSKQTLIHSPNLIFCSYSLSISPINTSNPTILSFTELHHPILLSCLQNPDCLAVKILGSCNGIVCFSPFDKMYVCLFNPSINSHRLIPPTLSRFPNPNREDLILNIRRPNGGFHTFVYGFGYDCDTDDYKLLRLLEYYKDDVFVGKEACLYSLKNGVWKFVCDDDRSFGIRDTEGCLVNGVLYFVMYNNGMIKPYLKCFNLRTETFSIVELPKFEERFTMFLIELRELGGCLFMALNNQKHDSNARGGYNLVSADMWIMKESWVKLFSINDPDSVGASLHIKPLVYSKDGRRVLFELDGRRFGWYDWEQKNFVRVIAHGLPPDNAPFNTWTFVESLVSLEKHKENPKEKTIPKKKKRNDVDGFLSSGFKLKL